MKYRHWQKIQQITGFTFDLERPGFCLKDILEAPLLPNKEDIEDVCISALKEKDIEAKLRAVTRYVLVSHSHRSPKKSHLKVNWEKTGSQFENFIGSFGNLRFFTF